jgi:two-component system, NtrC family, response regulator AtoC
MTGLEVGSVVAVSPAMRAVLEGISRLAGARSPVLVEGESGSGKNLVARLLHEQSPRRSGPFVKIHCPSMPGELLESDLFGHERGAFTDARSAKPGRIELADGGTLYFDQVQDLPLGLQAKILRVVEDKRFERLGGTETREVDVRIVSSSSVDLRRAVGAGTFREDLYHRLGVLPLALPPLRMRREDILPLAELFLLRERERGTTPARGFEASAAELLRGYSWPGNVRELRASVERAALYSREDLVSSVALPGLLLEQPTTLWAGREKRPSLKDLERAYIRYVLEQTEGSQTRAAEILGISRKALWEKRRRYGIP